MQVGVESGMSCISLSIFYFFCFSLEACLGDSVLKVSGSARQILMMFINGTLCASSMFFHKCNGKNVFCLLM